MIKSPAQQGLLKLGLSRDIDLALHLPLRYEDETFITSLSQAREGDVVQIEGEVIRSEVLLSGRRQLQVTLSDGTANCLLRFFSFHTSLQKLLSVGARIRARGELKGGFLGWAMMHPVCKPAAQPLPESLTPVYPTVSQLPQSYLRKAVLSGLKRADLSDGWPVQIDSPVGLTSPWSLKVALNFLHQPAPNVSLNDLENRSHPAWLRLKAEELLAQQLSQLKSRQIRNSLRAPSLGAQSMTLHDTLLQALPFRLTTAQKKVCSEIREDLNRQVPMHRLLQGDVGSGKTVVAALSACFAIGAGYQCALMAPTEILADQHFRKLVSWLEPLGVQVAWLTGSQKKKERDAMLALVASGEAGLVVGTHAVIQQHVQFKALALAIIDEQHRFGVAQRLALRNKSVDFDPHMLMMTATPIPRTLAMSYYADLDVSTIDELPPGRSPIVTRVVHESRRSEVLARIAEQIRQGRQVYWVCPLIEESEALDLSDATQTHAELSHVLLAQSHENGEPILVGLLHSRMHTAEKKAVMSAFVKGQISILVSTTVIEVGVDVPNATLMVIEHAERFGLSQLHQLRGRVGRGTAASACVLLYGSGDAPRLSETARARLKAMSSTQDGFEIAQRDLEIRGPGEFLGARQSGDALLRFANLAEDDQILDWARRVAPLMLALYPERAEHQIQRWLGAKAEFLKA